MDGNCTCPMISSGNALNEEKIVAKEEGHNSYMFGLPFYYINILFLLLVLYFKRCSHVLSEKKFKSSECSIVENKRKNWAEDGS